MGKALAEAAVGAGHEVVIVSGPVEVNYPEQAQVIPVISTEEMLAACRAEMVRCDGAIGVAAPCDYRPLVVAQQKIAKTGAPLELLLIETPDVIATLGQEKGGRWVVGFALETEDHRFRAIVKAERKSCDLMVLNSPSAMHSPDTEVEVLAASGDLVGTFRGPKGLVAAQIFAIIQQRFIAPRD